MSRSPLVVAAWALLACAACRSRSDELPEERQLLSDVRGRLSERERRLGAYRVEGVITEAGQRGEFTLAFRPPLKLKGTVSLPVRQTVSFDGKTFFQRDDASGKLHQTSLEGQDPAQVSAQLHSIFGQFVVEGFRAPLLTSSVRAKRLEHPQGPQAVELSVEARDPAVGTVKVSYVLRWPSLDFIEKRIEGPGTQRAGVRVDEERCEPGLALCVPTRWTHLAQGQAAAEVVLGRVFLGDEAPAEEFTLTAQAAPGSAEARGSGSRRGVAPASVARSSSLHRGWFRRTEGPGDVRRHVVAPSRVVPPDGGTRRRPSPRRRSIAGGSAGAATAPGPEQASGGFSRDSRSRYRTGGRCRFCRMQARRDVAGVCRDGRGAGQASAACSSRRPSPACRSP